MGPMPVEGVVPADEGMAGSVMAAKAHAVPADVDLLARGALHHMNALAPRHVHIVIAVLHVDAAGAYAHLVAMAMPAPAGSGRRVIGFRRVVIRCRTLGIGGRRVAADRKSVV